MRVAGLVLALCLGGLEAAAGAWPREPGSGFLSLGYEAMVQRDDLSAEGRARDPAPDVTGYGTLYAEIGLTPRLTAGLDFGWDEVFLTDMINDEVERRTKATGLTGAELDAFDVTDRRVLTWSRVAFLRAAIGPLDARHRFAVQLGIGQRSYEDPGPFFGREEMRQEAILRPALAYGYGFGGDGLSGWLSVEGSVEYRADTDGQVVKLDGTLGLKPAEGRLSYMLGVQSGDFPEADPFVKLVPGLVMRLTRNLALESSLIYGVHGSDDAGFKLAVWLEW